MPNFSINKCYNLICEVDIVHCDRYVWNRLSIPKHMFISWLIMLERLRIADRLFGLRSDDNCVPCSGKKSHKHLV